MKSNRKRLAGEWFTSAACGVSVLGLLRAAAPWLGFSLPLNGASLATAGLLGLPGVILLLVLRLLPGFCA